MRHVRYASHIGILVLLVVVVVTNVLWFANVPDPWRWLLH